MASSFLDTSALAKLYHEEPGSAYVERIVSQPGSKGIVSRLSLVEMESVFAIKVRTGALDENGRSIALRHLRADIARNRLTVGPPIEPKHYRAAAKLLRLHGASRGLRTLDALQLAIALDMLEVLLGSSTGRYFVKTYYAVSPPIAGLISRSGFLRRGVMYLVVRPAVRVVSVLRRPTRS